MEMLSSSTQPAVIPNLHNGSQCDQKLKSFMFHRTTGGQVNKY